MKIKSFTLCTVWLLVLCLPAQATDTLAILFTHDLHSYFTGSREVDNNHHVQRSGGYARLYTAIEQVRRQHPGATLLVDGGDVAMGAFFHTLFTTHFAELQLMDKMGYDAVTIGNHDFDFGVDALQTALQVYFSDASHTCAVVTSNIGGLAGTGEYIVLSRAGYRIGIFGLLGTEARSQSLIDKELPYENYITAAARMVKQLRDTEKVDVVVCLSHSGTRDNVKRSEDIQLARHVPGIDVIISGHSHTLLKEPLVEGHTVIGSAGAYGEYLGCIKLTVTDGKPQVASYKVIKIDSTLAENSTIKSAIESYKGLVESHYLKAESTGFDEPLAEVMNNVLASSNSIALEHLIADAFMDAAQKAENKRPDIAVVPSGTIREHLYEGIVTAEEVFNILPLGVGEDKKPAFPLLKVYFYGRELRDLCEVDASLSGSVPDVQLFFSGLRYTYYPGSLFCNKVKRVEVQDSAGAYITPDNNMLYSVIAGLYSAKMMGIVKEKTFGILSLSPKNAAGQPITDWSEAIIHDRAGHEVKEWVALKNYLQLGKKEGCEIPLFDYKVRVEERKIKQAGFSLVEEFKYMNTFALCCYITILLLLVTLLLFLYKIIRKSARYIRSWN
ncbi:MAG: bifunctional metallophosphatase/5'-nucleotidase [Prevotellaceae bacterium]|jgi:2',3'-cyclic-nucleotide 2'-phosphodiesterase (5'-nucleotidase family)|nr:bifunctional metallophosphatase/5'-nucleotidase [Prevotellaceae bacterium]